jgi:hypothetical protein
LLLASPRRQAVVSFDALAVCRLAGECYDRGEALPASLSDQEHRLAVTFLNALIMTETERWWRHDLPLPAHQPGTRP